MRWPQFLLALLNFGLSIYLILINVIFTDKIDPITLLWCLIYIGLALAISHLYMLYTSNKIDDWYDVESIKSITNLSIAMLTITSIALMLHLAIEYYYNKQLLASDSGAVKRVAPLVAALMSSIVLFSSSLKFKKYVMLCKAVDVQPTSTRRNYRTAD